MSKVVIPNCARVAYNYYLESLMKNSLATSYFITMYNSRDITLQDEFLNTQSEAQFLYTQSIKELERIEQNFNKEAEELGLPKPYPNV
jgi:hypothetical protein